MARITEEQKILINEIYYVCHNKAETARRVGVSASSVSKYIVPNYTPAAAREEITFDGEIKDFDIPDGRVGRELARYLINLTNEEKVELKEFQEKFITF